MSFKHPEVEAEKNERGKKEEMKVTRRGKKIKTFGQFHRMDFRGK
jgi:hypothetical protein